MLKSLVFFVANKGKKSIKLTKIVKIKEVKIMSSERLDEFQLNWRMELMMTLKVTKKTLNSLQRVYVLKYILRVKVC